ncbi:DUF2304 domain-containing protein [Halosimplex marinum]|uniref:DUF2304 domain-containing protein n=1 Tax=Halosimplex marinum TaxID=3396620 RepID=UPI003F5511DC
MVAGFEPMHIVGMLVSFALFYQSYRLVRKHKEGIVEFLFWVSFGGALFLLSVGDATAGTGRFPIFDLVKRFLLAMGFSSGVNGIFTLTILGLILLIFYTYVNVKTNRQMLYDQTQEIALLRYELEQERDEESGD